MLPIIMGTRNGLTRPGPFFFQNIMVGFKCGKSAKPASRVLAGYQGLILLILKQQLQVK